jgi:hypothetical protein
MGVEADPTKGIVRVEVDIEQGPSYDYEVMKIVGGSVRIGVASDFSWGVDDSGAAYPGADFIESPRASQVFQFSGVESGATVTPACTMVYEMDDIYTEGSYTEEGSCFFEKAPLGDFEWTTLAKTVTRIRTVFATPPGGGAL